jgi:hypothetical protein
MNTNIENFKKNGYCLVKSAISDEMRNFVTQYGLFDELQDFSLDPNQVPGAHAKYLDPAMESLLLVLLDTMQQNTGLVLHPTYSYFRVYRAGQELKPHIDRQSCEISATLCFNFSYDPKKYMWPIFMDGNRIDMMPGEMAIYKGAELSHWREKFSPPAWEGDWHMQGFFHYVNANGPFAEYKFDQRAHIGEPRAIPKNYKSYLRVNEEIYLKGKL